MTDAVLLALPVGVPWLVAVALALLDGRKRWVGLLAAAVLREGTVETTAGGWPVDVGITLRADALGVTFATVSLGIILVSLLYEISLGVRWRAFPVLALFAAAGLTGLFHTGDVFNFYVFLRSP